MAWHFGADLATTSGPCGANFYIGKIGYGLTVSHDWHLGSSANVYAFGFWNVTGPSSKPASLTLGQWGSHQANAFWSAISAGPPTGKFGHTLFGSIDTAGYSGATKSHAKSVLTGFYNRLASLTSGKSFTLGIYGGRSQYVSRLGAASWTPPQPLVVWEAYYPYSTIPSCSQIETDYATDAQSKVGSYITMIWQYSGTPTNPDDLDVTPYDGGPVSGKWNPTT